MQTRSLTISPGPMRLLGLRLGLLLAVAAASPAHGQTSMDGGARAAALGGARTALPADASATANPAAWATRGGGTLTLFATQAFGLSALRLASLHLVQTTRFGTVGGGARTFGFAAYREVHVQAGYAHGFRLGTTRRFYAGVGVRYHRLRIDGYGSAGTVGLALGGMAALRPGLWAGFRATNVHVPRLGGYEALPRTLALGMAYTPSEALLVVLDVMKDVRFPVSVRAGAEVWPVTAVALRVGAATEPARITTGLGLRLGNLSADLAAERHEALGWSPAFSVALSW